MRSTRGAKSIFMTVPTGRHSAAPPWAPHTTRLVAGQLLEGWLTTLVNTAAHDGSIFRSPDRSPITAAGCSAKRLTSTRRNAGIAARWNSPTGARMAQPSRVDWSIRFDHLGQLHA